MSSLGERLFNGREIRRISRQEQETAPSGFNGLSHTRSLMNAQVIQDHDLTWFEAGSKQRHNRSIIARNLADSSLSSGSIGIERSHRNMGTGLIDKHQILAEQLLHLLTPSRTSRIILLACSQGLFFRVHPRAALARLMLAVLTATPCSAWNRRQCSSRVASGWASNWALKWACNTAPFLAGRPGIAFGKTWPVSRRCLR